MIFLLSQDAHKRQKVITEDTDASNRVSFGRSSTWTNAKVYERSWKNDPKYASIWQKLFTALAE